MARPHTDIDAGREDLIDLVVEQITERGLGVVTVTEVAALAGMSPASFYRYFPSKDALIEAVAERWFQPKVAIMEEVVASTLPPRRKMYEFFARRFALMKAEWERDPVAFSTYVELGREHFELIRSYVDLGDHYLAEIIAEAMTEGHFGDLSIDETLSLVNQMVSVYVNIGAMEPVMPKLSTDKLARIIDAIFDGLGGADRGAKGVAGLRAA
jgi:AcrR family transcriptional regulator